MRKTLKCIKCGCEFIDKYYQFKRRKYCSRSCAKKGQITRCGEYAGKYKTKTEGLSYHPLYVVYNGMKSRCKYPSHRMYPHYGGKGVRVCEEWQNSFKAFYEWCISNGWRKGLQIDRFPDRNGNYHPSNCRIVTHKENQNNRDDNYHITYKNETKILFDWAKQIGVHQTTLSRRLKKMSVEDAINYTKYKKIKSA